jgi:hypothetical protein
MSTTMGNEDQSMRDFSEPQLKPAPLRLPKSQSSNSAGGINTLEPPSKHVHINDTAVEMGRERNNASDALPPSPKAFKGILAALVCKFETLGSVGDTKATHLRSSSDMTPLEPSERGIVQLASEDQQSPKRPLKDSVQPATSSLEASSNAIDRISAATQSLASMLHHDPLSDESNTPVKGECHTHLDHSLESSGISGDMVSPKPQAALVVGRLEEGRGHSGLQKGLQAGERKGWHPMLVADRRRLFERLSGQCTLLLL